MSLGLHYFSPTGFPDMGRSVLTIRVIQRPVPPLGGGLDRQFPLHSYRPSYSRIIIPCRVEDFPLVY